jgi:hypothetical protein
MSSEQKIPLSRALSAFTRSKALSEIVKRWRVLPGHVVAVAGSIVTINFDVQGQTLPQVTMPLAGPEYIRYPIQVGDMGVALPASVYLGGVSGLGGGMADKTLRGNLATLWWVPISNANWSAVDPNAVTIYGPNGVALMDTAGHTKATLTPAGLAVTAQTSISLTVGSHNITIDSAGVHIDGRLFLAHEHTPGTYAESGGSAVTGNSGGVV